MPLLGQQCVVSGQQTPSPTVVRQQFLSGAQQPPPPREPTQHVGVMSWRQQAPLEQVLRPSPHRSQFPFVHVTPDGQAVPHPPQLFGSLWVSTQSPLHTVSLSRSFKTHTLFTSSPHPFHGA